MDQRLINLRGSASRDAWLQKHKELGTGFHGTDIDFVMIERTATNSFVVAVLDYKQKYDDVTYAEAVFYRMIIDFGVYVFILIADYNKIEDSFVFPWEIKQLQKVYWKRPGVEYGKVWGVQTWDEYKQWERKLRDYVAKTKQPIQESYTNMLTCPNCNQRIHLRATVDAFNEPDGWLFYGEQGNRWIVCDTTINGQRYVHFRVRANGRDTHRLAVIRR